MIIVSNIDAIRSWVEQNRPDKDSIKPYFLEVPVEGGYQLPNDELIKRGLKEIGEPHTFVTMIEDVVIELESQYLFTTGAYYRRTGDVDENGNYYLEYSQEVTLSDGTVINSDNKNIYDGAEGWHWYADGDFVDIATPSTWERIKNWFSF